MMGSILFILLGVLVVACIVAVVSTAKVPAAAAKANAKAATGGSGSGGGGKTYTHNPKPVYSSRRCTYSDDKKVGGERASGGKGGGEGDSNHATCELKNVCYNFRESRWEYHSQKGRVKEAMPSPLLHLGGYSSSPTLSFNVVDTPMHHSDQDARWVSAPTVLYQGVSHLYMHWLLDDLFGLWWMMREWKLLDTTTTATTQTTQVVWVGKKGKWVESTIEGGWFTSQPVRELDSFYRPQMQVRGGEAAEEGRDRVCFKQLYAGPSAYHLGGPGVSQVFRQPQLVREFSDYLLTRAGVTPHTTAPPPALNSDNKDNARQLPTTPVVTVVVREGGAGRQIVNLQEVKDYLRVNRPEVKVQYLDLAALSLREQLRALAETTILVGIHGSGLANLIFLPHDASVIQLFPYKFYRPTYNYIARLAGIKVLDWKNEVASNTVFHPEIMDNYPTLSAADKEDIMRNPESTSSTWAANMYWITQDTILDISAFDRILQDALNSGIHLTMKIEQQQQQQQQQQGGKTTKGQQASQQNRQPPVQKPQQGSDKGHPQQTSSIHHAPNKKPSRKRRDEL